MAERPDYFQGGEAILKNAPIGQIPTDSTLPEMLYDFEVVDCYPGKTAGSDEKQPVLKVSMILQITSPPEVAGRYVQDSFNIGTQDDPEARDSKTWLSYTNFGAINLERLRVFLGLPDFASFVGQKFSAFTRNSVYNGSQYSNVDHRNHYTPGQIAAGTPSTKTGNSSGNRYGRTNPTPATANASASVSNNSGVLIPCPND